MAKLQRLNKPERNRLQPGLFGKPQLAQSGVIQPTMRSTKFRYKIRAPSGRASKKRVSHPILSFIGSGARF